MPKTLFSVLVIIAVSLTVQEIYAKESLKSCRRIIRTSCVLQPELTEGPYYWNTSLMRQNISEDRVGVRFRLQALVMDVNTCSSIANAAVILWHCDALGIYSHYIQASENVQNPKNDNQTFLRGIQLTNSSGVATFDTIYPGWYVGRATHMHVKVALGGSYINANSYYSGATHVHTSQLFFNDSFSDLVYEQSPYSNSTGNRTLNSEDDIYEKSLGYTLMNVQYVNSANGMSDGLITSITLYVNSTASSISTTTAASSTTTTVVSSTTTTTVPSITTTLTSSTTTTIVPSTTTTVVVPSTTTTLTSSTTTTIVPSTTTTSVPSTTTTVVVPSTTTTLTSSTTTTIVPSTTTTSVPSTTTTVVVPSTTTALTSSTTTIVAVDTTSTMPSNSAGCRVGGKPFWFW